MARKRRPPIAASLLQKSREAALNAVQIFNNPLATFKTEVFIVVMSIAWTYLLHAYYHRNGIEYRHFKQGPKRRKFERTPTGEFRYWELARCLKDATCPLDEATKCNLRFLIKLRNEIVHHNSAGVDERLSGRYFACCLNFEHYVCELFGQKHSLGDATAIALNFRDIVTPRDPLDDAKGGLPANVAKFVQEFDADLPEGITDSHRFKCRLLFTPIVASKTAQAERVVEFVRPDSDLGRSINDQYRQMVIKEVERPKYLPSAVVKEMQEDGYVGFKIHHHTKLWQARDGKNPGRSYGVVVSGTWYWYERWIGQVKRHCEEHRERYAGDAGES